MQNYQNQPSQYYQQQPRFSDQNNLNPQEDDDPSDDEQQDDGGVQISNVIIFDEELQKKVKDKYDSLKNKIGARVFFCLLFFLNEKKPFLTQNTYCSYFLQFDSKTKS